MTPRPGDRRHAGYSLLELLAVCAVAALLAAAVVPAVLAGLERGQAKAAARYLASRMRLARAEAVARGAAVALRFEGAAGSVTFGMYVDGNGNGVRSSDIVSSVDRPLGPAIDLGHLFPRVSIGRTGTAAETTAVQLGATNLLSFAPAGTATSGSIYIAGADGSQYVVRVLGVTGRCRVLWLNPLSNTWVEVT